MKKQLKIGDRVLYTGSRSQFTGKTGVITRGDVGGMLDWCIVKFDSGNRIVTTYFALEPLLSDRLIRESKRERSV